jgi:nucleoside-diphosphate kinase
MQQTLIVVKPDGVKRRLCGDVVSAIEKTLLEVVEMRMTTATAEFAQAHYEEHKDKQFFDKLCASFSSGPVLAIVAEGYEAVRVGRIVLEEIRSRYAQSSHENVVHASDSEESARREILLWFGICECGSPILAELGAEYKPNKLTLAEAIDNLETQFRKTMSQRKADQDIKMRNAKTQDDKIQVFSEYETELESALEKFERRTDSLKEDMKDEVDRNYEDQYKSYHESKFRDPVEKFERRSEVSTQDNPFKSTILEEFGNNRLTQQELELAGYSSVDEYFKSQFPDPSSFLLSTPSSPFVTHLENFEMRKIH